MHDEKRFDLIQTGPDFPIITFASCLASLNASEGGCPKVGGLRKPPAANIKHGRRRDTCLQLTNHVLAMKVAVQLLFRLMGEQVADPSTFVQPNDGRLRFLGGRRPRPEPIGTSIVAGGLGRLAFSLVGGVLFIGSLRDNHTQSRTHKTRTHSHTERGGGGRERERMHTCLVLRNRSKKSRSWSVFTPFEERVSLNFGKRFIFAAGVSCLAVTSRLPLTPCSTADESGRPRGKRSSIKCCKIDIIMIRLSGSMLA